MSMEIINLIALIVVPIAAVYIGQKLQDREQKRKDKIQIFKILMTSRIFGWTNDSVQAMNLIDVVFADDKDVCDQWKVCFDKMRIENPTETDLLKMKTEKEKLLEKMAKSLGYKNISFLFGYPIFPCIPKVLPTFVIWLKKARIFLFVSRTI